MLVKALRDCFAADATFRAKGSITEYNGPENKHLVPLDKAPKNADDPPKQLAGRNTRVVKDLKDLG